MIELVAGALGSGLGATVFFFPVVYFAMNKQYKLRPAKQLWLPAAVTWVSMSLAYLLGIGDDSGSWSGIMTFIVLPIVVSAAALAKLGRQLSDQ